VVYSGDSLVASLEGKERERLVALLGMTGSDGDGEALNAARLANKFLKDRKLTWVDVIGGTVTVEKVVVVETGKKSAPKEHQEMAREIMDAYGNDLKPKEYSFVNDMMTWNVPSAKQLDWLRTIYERYY
jgi:hypothetical protein